MAAPEGTAARCQAGKKSKDVSLDEAVFAAEVKPHLVHEAVRAELNAQRAGTFATKSRGLVSGGRAKPWRQKGTGRARQGTIRAPQFTGGGHAFAKVPRTFDPEGEPEGGQGRAAVGSRQSRAGGHARARRRRRRSRSRRRSWPRALLEASGQRDAARRRRAPTTRSNLVKSFRNLERVVVVAPSELEVGAVVWARSLLVSEAALPLVEGRAQLTCTPARSSSRRSSPRRATPARRDGKYTFRVHQDAHKTQVRQAVEELFEVKVVRVNIIKVQAKPKRRGMIKGTRPAGRRPSCSSPGDTIEIFEGAQL